MTKAKQIKKVDICVIGAGAAGLSVAAGAVAFGANVVLIEKDKMGGDCLNTGCVPSKALIAAAKKAHNFVVAKDFGVDFSKPKINYKKVQSHVKSIIAQIAPHDSVERFEGLGVNVIKAPAQFIDERTIKAGENIIRARRFVIATGSRPAIPPILGLDKIPYLTNESIFDLKALPKHLIIIGGGAIGMEMAQAFSRLGAKISVLEKFSALNVFDPELSNIAIETLINEGVNIYQKCDIENIKQQGQEIFVTIKQENTSKIIKGSHILIATGRKANIEGLELEKAGVSFSKKAIEINSALRTSNKKIFAIGDVTGELQFTHVAAYHASLVVRNALFGLPIKMNKNIIPYVSYVDPEIAHIGLSKKQATEKYGKKIKIVCTGFAENDRAKAIRKTDGVLKLILKSNGTIIGCSIIGENAGELISLFSFAIKNKQKAISLASFIVPYPTLSEIVKKAGVESFRDKLSNPMLKIWTKLISKLP